MGALTVTPSNRFCMVERMERPTPAALRRDILNKRKVQTGFSLLSAPAGAHDDVVFKIAGNDRIVLVAAALYDSVVYLAPGKPMNDVMEILFDLRGDRLGYFQFILSPAKEEQASGAVNPHRDKPLNGLLTQFQFQPYPEASGSGWKPLEMMRWETREEWIARYSISGLRVRWFFAWFDAKALFRHGNRIGFNLARFRPCLHEFSSWNYCSGNGSPDATAFGTLYRGRAPAVCRIGEAALVRDTLTIGGRLENTGRQRQATFRLTAPDGADETFKVRPDAAGSWTASLPMTLAMPGRYRLSPVVKGTPVEPDYTALDLPDRALSEGFKVSLLFDTPMCIVSNFYTPGRLRDQMRVIRDLGVDRLHWQYYGDWPSFWHSKTLPWAAQAGRTFRSCPDLLKETVKAAHGAGLELIGDLKVFDLGFNCFFVDRKRKGWGTALELENRHSCVIPEIEDHPEWTLRDRPEWRRPAASSIARIRFYSRDPIPRLDPASVRLYTSADNITFRPYRGNVAFRQGREPRRHRLWTPAGLRQAPGSQVNDYLEWSGLHLTVPYFSVRIEGKAPVQLRHRGFMLAEAEGPDGREAPFTLATNGNLEQGFFFWKGWQGWNNMDEALLQDRVLDGRNLGLVFREADRMPTMLEPAFEGARRIWLNRVSRILAGGADGVSIRTYCHHNGPMHYMKYAYAAPVVTAFRERWGRDPEAGVEDETRIRRIRADFYSQFIRDASVLTRARGGKFMVELESGAEIPDTLSSRMQLPMEWRRWIEEGWLDEIRLKYFTAENPFIHREVLPAARARGIPVQLISRCLHQGVDLRTREIGALLGRRATASGFSGYCLYEQQNLMDINQEGLTEVKGPVGALIGALKGLYEVK